jgi:hypothetical protein
MPAIHHPIDLKPGRLFSLRFISFVLFSLMVLNVVGQQQEGNPPAFLRLNEVNSHAARHFLSHFSQATSVKWTRSDNYYIAIFESDHSRSRVVYSNNGNFAFCIKYYLADGLNPDVKSNIIKKFPGCQIRTVTELTGQDKKYFIVNIKSGVYLKTLSCTDEGIEITENITDAGI